MIVDGERTFTYAHDMDYQAKIAGFYKTNGRMPSYAEIAKLVGFKSKNAAYKLVRALEEKGVLKKDRKGRLIPKRLFGEIKVLGLVEAGFPSPAEEELVDTMTLDEWLISNREATFIVKVKGDSMIEAGIMEGDMVLVERGRTPVSGDIVIAEVDGDSTMKYLSKRGDKVMLLPANKKYKPIIPIQELKVTAVVVAVIRKYHV
jgi:repressor LexA